MEEFAEGVGESSSPVRGSFPGVFEVRNEVYNRLMNNGNEEAASDPDFRDHLNAHFNRLPARYAIDVNMDRAEDVLLHQKLLAQAKGPDKQPVFCVRFMESIPTKPDGNDDIEQSTAVASTSGTCFNAEVEEMTSNYRRNVTPEGHFEPCLKLGDLNLDVIRNDEGPERLHVMENLSGGQELQHVHEIIFSTTDKPKLLSQLSALLSDIGLNIREAHVFSTTDGFSLDVFVVDGWRSEDTEGLHEAVRKAVLASEGTCSSPHSVMEKALADALKPGDWEIDRKMLQMGKMIASGSCGDLYRGTYLGIDVAVKVLKSENLNDEMGVEFVQEIMMLREIQHTNTVRFIGACIKRPQLCILTEYMAGGSLYDYLRDHGVVELPMLLKFAIDVSKGMEYLHGSNIIHRDLKTANLLLDSNNVVKVADFGVARFQKHDGTMTAETGTYRWMAPEVINHKAYDEKADVFSFGIVLWELTTAKIPYNTMTPLQAALGVRQGLRPEVPDNVHPGVLELMQRCWGEDPTSRPSFSGITLQLELMLQEIQQE